MDGYLNTVYRNAQHEETEWEAVQRKFGNLPPLERPPPPPPFSPAAAAAGWDAASLAAASPAQLAGAQDELDDRALEELRAARLAQLRAGAAAPRFGAVLRLQRDDFVRQVTAASRARGQDVVVLLTRSGHAACAAAEACLDALAASHPRVKCCSLSAEEALGEGYPDSRLPTLLVYREGDVALTLAGAAAVSGGPTLRHMTPEALARLLDDAPGGRVFNVSAEEWEARQRELDLAAGRGRDAEAGRGGGEEADMDSASSDFED